MFKYPKPQVTRVNIKPLLPTEDLDALSVQRALKRLQREVLKQLRGKILQTTFSNRAKQALSKGMEVKIGPNSITVIAKHPAFRPLLEGQRPGQMRWLTKAKRPIPIVTDEGELIFRSATPRSMDNGSWYHPGRAPTTVIERARTEARALIRKRLKKDLQKQVRAMLAKDK